MSAAVEQKEGRGIIHREICQDFMYDWMWL